MTARLPIEKVEGDFILGEFKEIDLDELIRKASHIFIAQKNEPAVSVEEIRLGNPPFKKIVHHFKVIEELKAPPKDRHYRYSTGSMKNQNINVLMPYIGYQFDEYHERYIFPGHKDRFYGETLDTFESYNSSSNFKAEKLIIFVRNMNSNTFEFPVIGAYEEMSKLDEITEIIVHKRYVDPSGSWRYPTCMICGNGENWFESKNVFQCSCRYYSHADCIKEKKRCPICDIEITNEDIQKAMKDRVREQKEREEMDRYHEKIKKLDFLDESLLSERARIWVKALFIQPTSEHEHNMYLETSDLRTRGLRYDVNNIKLDGWDRSKFNEIDLGSIQFILAENIFYKIENEHREEFLHTVHDILRPRGFIYFITECAKKDKETDDIQSPEDILDEIKGSGFYVTNWKVQAKNEHVHDELLIVAYPNKPVELLIAQTGASEEDARAALQVAGGEIESAKRRLKFTGEAKIKEIEKWIDRAIADNKAELCLQGWGSSCGFIITDSDLETILPKIKEIKNIYKLEIESHLITKIPAGINELTSLKILSFRINKIQKIENLDKLTILKGLDLYGNQIHEIENLENLKQLEYLNLENNCIYEIKNLDNLTTLVFLYLGGNRIYKMKNLDKFSRLRHLELQNNNIKEIENLDNPAFIETLYLYGNPIKEIKNLDKLTWVENLGLDVETLSAGKFSLNKLPSLEMLYLNREDHIWVGDPDKLIDLSFEDIKNKIVKSRYDYR